MYYFLSVYPLDNNRTDTIGSVFIYFNGRKILYNPGKVFREVAEKFALSEFEKNRIIQEQRLISDYDLFISDTKFEEIPNIVIITIKNIDRYAFKIDG